MALPLVRRGAPRGSRWVDLGLAVVHLAAGVSWGVLNARSPSGLDLAMAGLSLVAAVVFARQALTGSPWRREPGPLAVPAPRPGALAVRPVPRGTTLTDRRHPGRARAPGRGPARATTAGAIGRDGRRRRRHP